MVLSRMILVVIGGTLGLKKKPDVLVLTDNLLR